MLSLQGSWLGFNYTDLSSKMDRVRGDKLAVPGDIEGEVRALEFKLRQSLNDSGFDIDGLDLLIAIRLDRNISDAFAVGPPDGPSSGIGQTLFIRSIRRY